MNESLSGRPQAIGSITVVSASVIDSAVSVVVTIDSGIVVSASVIDSAVSAAVT